MPFTVFGFQYQSGQSAKLPWTLDEVAGMTRLRCEETDERIREMDKHVLIFFLSDRSDKADRLQGFQLKANDYLAKPFYPEELTARIRERFTSQLSGVAEDEMYAFGHSVFNYSTNEIRTGNSKVLITSRQADILRLLALNVNKTVSRDTLLDAVWGTASYANSLP